MSVKIHSFKLWQKVRKSLTNTFLNTAIKHSQHYWKKYMIPWITSTNANWNQYFAHLKSSQWISLVIRFRMIWLLKSILTSAVHKKHLLMMNHGSQKEILENIWSRLLICIRLGKEYKVISHIGPQLNKLFINRDSLLLQTLLKVQYKHNGEF